MRLIDGDALRDEFKARCICECDSCKYQKGAYCRLIDLAPTLDASMEVNFARAESYQRGYDNGYQNGLKMGKKLNPPKARWKITSMFDSTRGYWAECSNCHEIIFGGGLYCSSCGAKMDAKED